MSNGYVSTKTLSRIISSGPLISTITEEAVGLEFYSSEGTILCLIELTRASFIVTSGIWSGLELKAFRALGHVVLMRPTPET